MDVSEVCTIFISNGDEKKEIEMPRKAIHNSSYFASAFSKRWKEFSEEIAIESSSKNNTYNLKAFENCQDLNMYEKVFHLLINENFSEVFRDEDLKSCIEILKLANAIGFDKCVSQVCDYVASVPWNANDLHAVTKALEETQLDPSNSSKLKNRMPNNELNVHFLKMVLEKVLPMLISNSYPFSDPCPASIDEEYCKEMISKNCRYYAWKDLREIIIPSFKEIASRLDSEVEAVGENYEFSQHQLFWVGNIISSINFLLPLFCTNDVQPILEWLAKDPKLGKIFLKNISFKKYSNLSFEIDKMLENICNLVISLKIDHWTFPNKFRFNFLKNWLFVFSKREAELQRKGSKIDDLQEKLIQAKKKMFEIVSTLPGNARCDFKVFWIVECGESDFNGSDEKFEV